MSDGTPLVPFIFYRAEGWYVVEIPADHLQANIELNPGTLRVETLDGRVVWRLQCTGPL